MKDAYTLRRRQWLRQLSRRYKRNMRGIDAEELSYYVSERAALVIVAVLVFGVITRVVQ